MFIGSIDQPSRIICENILATVDKAQKPHVYVGCSGNFTFDRIAHSRGFQVHSNDVALYSRIIAGIVQKDRFPFTCVNPELIPIFAEWDNNIIYTDIIMIMYAAKYGQFAERKNDYQRTMLDNYISGAKAFYEGALAFLINGEIFGFASFSSSLGTSDPKKLLFLHSDFVVPSKIERLSKLLLYILRSITVYKLILRYYIHAYAGLQTSVYTDKPVSMKYRGIFSKFDNPDPKKTVKGKLTYIGNFTKLSIEECFEKWKNRKSLTN